MIRPPPRSTLFPYPTPFRSCTVFQLPPTHTPQSPPPDTTLPAPGATPPTVLLLPSTDRKSTRLNSSHTVISYAVFCLQKTIRVSPSLRACAIPAVVAPAVVA